MRISRALCLLSVIAITSGCSLVDRFPKRQALSTAAQHELSVLDSHLNLMRDIADGDYQQQEDRFAELNRTNDRVGSSRTALRLALARVTTGHPNTDIGLGYQELQTVLAAPGDLHPSERNLLAVLLNESESAMIQAARNAELNSAIDATKSAVANQANAVDSANLLRAKRQLTSAREKIRLLEQELADARAKLDAIKRIEVTSE